MNKSSFMMAFFINRTEIDMENEIYRFYESKFRIFCILFWSIILLLGSYWLSKNVIPKEKFIGYAGLVFFGAGLVIGITKIFSNKVLVEVSPTYIKMYNFEKLLWTDITNVREVQIYSIKFLYFYVEDISKYKLTFWQKFNKIFGHSPFCLSLEMLSKEDLEKLQQLIRLYADNQ